ncbi:MAG: ABC transporter ATP-binding protein [Candidatus Eremiobacteraeota bacterium]|nr:ABC transporter ATP-binding protein [Candidatus Eremiobacteraeota bacterium]
MNGTTVAAIELRGASKRYGSVLALDGIDLSIPQGQVIAILGPNGAGKTTAISLMLGLRAPTAGSVQVLGGNPRDIATRTSMGAMLQTSGVPEYLRVDEAIELFRTYYPNPMPTAQIVQTCGLADNVKTRVARLSGGQLQRLYFGLALCGDPPIVLLDEPTVGLDVEARRLLLSTIEGIAKSGRTVVLTTHYLEEADALADRIVVIDRGKIVADGTPAQIKATVGRKRVSYLCEGTKHEVLTDAPEALLFNLYKEGLQISELTVVGASLEEAFLQITAREENHAA